MQSFNCEQGVIDNPQSVRGDDPHGRLKRRDQIQRAKIRPERGKESAGPFDDQVLAPLLKLSYTIKDLLQSNLLACYTSRNRRRNWFAKIKRIGFFVSNRSTLNTLKQLHIAP